jgi:hypothetical protein
LASCRAARLRKHAQFTPLSSPHYSSSWLIAESAATNMSSRREHLDRSAFVDAMPAEFVMRLQDQVFAHAKIA